MSLKDIVETQQSAKTLAKRTTYGIEIKAGSIPIQEWGLTETMAKEVNDVLVANGDQAFTIEGLTFSRKPVSALSSALAELKASLPVR